MNKINLINRIRYVVRIASLYFKERIGRLEERENRIIVMGIIRKLILLIILVKMLVMRNIVNKINKNR
jgi:hypothetical protein